MTSIAVSDIVVLALETVVKMSIVLALGTLAARALRQSRPSGAHLAWVIAFFVIVAIPIASVFTPWRSVLFLGLRNAEVPIAGQLKVVHAVASDLKGHQTNVGADSAPAPISEKSASSAGLDLLLLLLETPWLLSFLGVWMCGATVVAARSMAGFSGLVKIRRNKTVPVTDQRLVDLTAALSSETEVFRKVDLRVCNTGQMPVPMTWGVFRPTVVLPSDALEWSTKRLEATLLHELSHVRRYDFLSQVLAEVACALYWFNPLVWLSARTMRSDAELAADEAVLHSGLKPSDYAAELLLIAADLGKRPIPYATLGTPAMTNSKIESRLESILAPAAGRRGITTVQALAATALAIMAIPIFASVHASAKGSGQLDAKAERAEAISRLKQVALATLMYASDYDGDYPYVQKSESMQWVLAPYSKRHELFKSPTKGGKFNFNLNLAGVNSAIVEDPAQVPMWFEWLPDPKERVAVAFADGHAKLCNPAILGDTRAHSTPSDPESLVKFLKRRYTRSNGMKPLPANYMLTGH